MKSITGSRHGESRANVERVFANRVEYAADLTEAGRSQAKVLACSLADWSITHVYTSPLPRAAQTAEIVANALEAPWSADPALCEYDVGDFEGQPYGGEHAWRWDAYEAVDRVWREGDLAARLANGESAIEIRARFKPFMDDLATRHASPDVVVAVGHGGLFRIVLPDLLSNVSSAFVREHGFDYGTMVVATWDGARWHCRRWGDVPIPG